MVEARRLGRNYGLPSSPPLTFVGCVEDPAPIPLITSFDSLMVGPLKTYATFDQRMANVNRGDVRETTVVEHNKSSFLRLRATGKNIFIAKNLQKIFSIFSQRCAKTLVPLGLLCLAIFKRTWLHIFHHKP